MKKLVCLFLKKGRLHSCSTTGVNFLKILFQLCLHFSRRTCGGPVFRDKKGTGAEMHPAIDLIHDTHHLCTRSRTDGIKAMSRGFSGGRQEKNIAKGRNRSGIYCSRQQETKTFSS